MVVFLSVVLQKTVVCNVRSPELTVVNVDSGNGLGPVKPQAIS